MRSTTEAEFAVMLQRFSEGDPEASNRLISLLYSELHRLAQGFMSNQPQGHSMQATALVSEAYLRLLGNRRRTWNDRRHLMAAAATAMRWVLVEHARKRRRRKREVSETPGLDDVLVLYESRAIDLLALDEALQQLAEMAPEMAHAVELRFFAGLSMEEVADVLEMPKRALLQQWETTRVWLYERMS